MTIPQTIVRINRFFYMDSTNGKKIPAKKVREYVIAKRKQTDMRLSHEDIIDRRWDLKYD